MKRAYINLKYGLGTSITLLYVYNGCGSKKMMMQLQGFAMQFDRNSFLDARSILNDSILSITSKDQPITTDTIKEFCITLTDYLTNSVINLNLPDNFSLATQFSNRYVEGFKSELQLKRDLSQVIMWLSERWDREDHRINELSKNHAN